MKVEVHILTHDYEPMTIWAIRHYQTFASRIVLHDGGPQHTNAIPSAMFPEIVTLPWDTEGKLNDALAKELKNTCWKGKDADWVICVDADELIYFPKGAELSLATYAEMGAAVIKPYGYEMFSSVHAEGSGQIYDEIKFGARDDKWYAKPALFRPAMVRENEFGIGAHDSLIILKDVRQFYVGQDWPKADPPCYLLHYHQIGTLEEVAARYDATRKRLADVNVQHNWGNFDPGLFHAKAKRDLILPRLEQVVP